MDDFDKYSSNNNSEPENEFSSPDAQALNDNNADADFSESSEPANRNTDSCFSDENNTPVNGPVANEQNQWNNIPPINNGTYNGNFRSQTPPPYYYGQNPNQPPQNRNPYSNGQPYNNSNPYPYANRPSTDNKQVSFAPNSNKNSGNKTARTIFIIVAALIVLLIGIVVGIVKNSDSKPSDANTDASVSTTARESDVDDAVTQNTPSDSSSKSTDGLSPKEIYNKISEASVGVIVYENSNTESGEGSGVLLKEDKSGKYTYIITCAHVISGAKKAIVQLSDNTEYEADIIGADSRTDIGVLRIEAHGLTLAEIGDSEKINVGDSVYAIGNPGGTSFAGSFTDGMISALDRPVNSETGYTMKCIQHTAAINPGNSGGALVNSYGQLIGINSSKIVSEDYEGMGFSVPSSVFVDIFNSIVSNGYVANRAKLGITYVLASEYNSAYGMYVAIKGLPSGSLVVYSISSDSDLVNTDVQKGDLIVSVNGIDLDDASTLAEAVEKGSVGDTLTLGIVRINENYQAEEFKVKVKLVEDKDGSSATTEESTTQEYSMDDYFRQYFGDSYGNDSGDYYGYGGSSNGGNFGW